MIKKIFTFKGELYTVKAKINKAKTKTVIKVFTNVIKVSKKETTERITKEVREELERPFKIGGKLVTEKTAPENLPPNVSIIDGKFIESYNEMVPKSFDSPLVITEETRQEKKFGEFNIYGKLTPAIIKIWSINFIKTK